MFERPEKKKQRQQANLADIRANALRTQHHKEEAKAKEQHHEVEEGGRAAVHDMDRIVKMVKEAMDSGKDFLELGPKFTTKAPQVKERKLRNNSAEFVKGYGDKIQETLGKEAFFVKSHQHHRDAHVRILWAPRRTGGHH